MAVILAVIISSIITIKAQYPGGQPVNAGPVGFQGVGCPVKYIHIEIIPNVIKTKIVTPHKIQYIYIF